MKDYKSEWAYPLTNVSKCGNGQEPKPCATVKDADGVVILNFIGIPWRSNNEAIAMATTFCERMNAQHNKSVGNAAKMREALEVACRTLRRNNEVRVHIPNGAYRLGCSCGDTICRQG